jgi:APA family basic amino acid/polyamine antiporter
MMVMLLGQSRIFMGMSKDGLIPKFFSDLHVKNKTPYKSNILIGLIVALVAGFTPISTLADMTSFGTLFAFTMVCIAVWMLRVKEPNLQRNFKVPALPLIAVLGIGINIFLMSKLNLHAIQLSGAWLVLGVVIYFVYSKQNSKLRKAANA